MGLFDLINHLLNFAAPAFCLAVVLALTARLFIKKRPFRPTLRAQVAINFIVSLFALVGGLVVFSHDGKMLTYTAMAVCCGTSQWLMLRGWK